jgi:GT2 family glycosyltransferase
MTPKQIVLPSWSLCIATLDRRDALLLTLEFAARQTCPPTQIVVVDASEDWQETATQVRTLLADYPDITLDYTTSEVRSSATQRNEGVARCSEEIVFLLDDDSLLYPDAAEEILRLYAIDTEGAVAGIAAAMVPQPPFDTKTDIKPVPMRKTSGRRGFAGRLLRTGFGRWLSRTVFMEAMSARFIKYDPPRSRSLPAALSAEEVVVSDFMQGCAMTGRRAVFLAEPFDTALRYYAAGEDMDTTYRMGRHGLILVARRAKLHHFEAASGRLKRKKVIIFSLLNMIIYLKRNAADPDLLKPRYRRLLRRRLLAECLKDALSGRVRFPQASAVLIAMRHWRAIWKRDMTELETWYPEFQKTILEQM